jgi:hypothetical protein
MRNSSPHHLFELLAGLVPDSNLLVPATPGSTSWLHVRNSQFIPVKGSTRKDAEQLVIWKGSFTTEAATLLEAQKKLKEDASKVEQFLRNRQMTNFNFVFALK